MLSAEVRSAEVLSTEVLSAEVLSAVVRSAEVRMIVLFVSALSGRELNVLFVSDPVVFWIPGSGVPGLAVRDVN